MNSTILYIILGVYAVMSLLSFIMMARDKRIATRNARRLKATRRIPERNLHLLELLGGWPGSLLAQRTVRHKTQQRAYQSIYWGIVILHVIAWAAVAFFMLRTGTGGAVPTPTPTPAAFLLMFYT